MQPIDFESETISFTESPIQTADFESAAPLAPVTESPMQTYNFEVESIPVTDLPIQSNDNPPTHQETEEDDDFGEFSEVQVAPKAEASPSSNVNLLTFIEKQIYSSAFF